MMRRQPVFTRPDTLFPYTTPSRLGRAPDPFFGHRGKKVAALGGPLRTRLGGEAARGGVVLRQRLAFIQTDCLFEARLRVAVDVARLGQLGRVAARRSSSRRRGQRA